MDDKEVAREIISHAFRSEAVLEELLRSLKSRLDEPAYRGWALKIAAAVDDINTALVRPALAKHPELEAEIEANLKATGRAFP